MQQPFDMYPTNYINQSGRQFSMPDLTVLQGNSAMNEREIDASLMGGQTGMQDTFPDMSESHIFPSPMPLPDMPAMPDMPFDPMPTVTPTPQNLAERVQTRQGCYIFAVMDQGCGHTIPIEGILYESGDDYFTIFDTARRAMTSFRINDIKSFTTLLSCESGMDTLEDINLIRPTR